MDWSTNRSSDSARARPGDSTSESEMAPRGPEWRAAAAGGPRRGVRARLSMRFNAFALPALIMYFSIGVSRLAF